MTQNETQPNIDVSELIRKGFDMGGLIEKVNNIDKLTQKIDEKLNRDYATKEWVNSEYGQTKKAVNYVMMLIGTAVIVALLALVIISNK